MVGEVKGFLVDKQLLKHEGHGDTACQKGEKATMEQQSDNDGND